MPRQREHARDGALVGGYAGLIEAIARQHGGTRPLSMSELAGRVVVGAGLGAVAASLPDLLEPADSPNHRGLFHSAILGAGLISALVATSSKNGGKTSLLALTAPAVAGYVAHLAKDSQTPQGIP